MTHEILTLLVRLTLAASAALVVVLALRVPLRRWLGAQAAYQLWLIVPVAALAMLLPAPVVLPTVVAPVVGAAASLASETPAAATIETAPFDIATPLLATWLIGVFAAAAFFVAQQRRFVRGLGTLRTNPDGTFAATATSGLPALVGAWRPRIVLPHDFESRYAPRERELMLAHERAHLARGDAPINALAAGARCLNWFNPLFHFAASRLRFDQELACDAVVIESYPEARRCYADAMLKAQHDGDSEGAWPLPVGCYWAPTHPLKERIAMLKFPVLTGSRRALASAILLVLACGAGYASWAAQPARMSEMPQTSASQASTGADIDAVLKIEIDGREMASPPWTSHTQVARYMRHDGKTNLWELGLISGQPFTLELTQPGENWLLKSVAAQSARGVMQLDATLEHDGKVVAKPSITLREGKPASIQAGEKTADGGFKGFKLDVTLTRAAVAAMHASPPPPPSLPSPSASMPALPAPPPSLKPSATGSAHATGAMAKSNAIVQEDRPPGENVEYRRARPPKYPANAIRAMASAKVMLKVLVDENGDPQSARIEKIALRGIDAAAEEEKEELGKQFESVSIAAAMSWKFHPGIRNGKPYSGYVLVPIDFDVHPCEDKNCGMPNGVKSKS